ncbi:hypothetical protein [Amphritea balenae]|uniref:Uncharacterized protein n=1 Tax=Amphritea balenae TaxID=452629 RepID=A0A3P1SM97_9GAMM|nr:hypothetical protein [Amphritea balenae]RRC98266.1 hypothetical protein EHS89_14335 [Amphritea balenae]GGK80495.1 hypothetical protein GCM10007941_33590 [Amphritea balenae]
MNSIFKPVEGSPVARTNMLSVSDSIDDVIHRLVEFDRPLGKVCFGILVCQRESGEGNEKYFRRFDRAIKQYIRTELGLDSKTEVKYSRGRITQSKAVFFYLGNKPTNTDGLLVELEENSISVQKAVQVLLSLLIKLDYLEEAAEIYDIQPALYNDEMFVGAFIRDTKSDGNVIIEALSYEIYYSDFDEISLSLHREVFDCSLVDTFVAEGEHGAIVFRSKKSMFRVNERLNATKESQRVYMGLTLKAREDEEKKLLSRYDNSVNYHQIDIQNKIISIFSEAGINHEPVVFCADHVCEEFVNPDQSYSDELVIIDCLSCYETDEIKSSFHDHLLTEFNASSVIPLHDAPSMAAIERNDKNYLVVNQLNRSKGTSIRIQSEGKELKSFSKALAKKTSQSDIELDYYTEAKLERLSQEISCVMQGVDVFKVSKKVKSAGGDTADSSLELKKLNKNIIKKVRNEIWLKESVFRKKQVSGFSLPEANLELFYVRRFNLGRRYRTYVSVVGVTTGEPGVKINSHKRYDDQTAGRFSFEYDFLQPVTMPWADSIFEGLRDNHFFIHDKDSGQILNSYHSARVPNVIGNTAFDNVERSRTAEGISRTNKVEETPLPYYLTYSSKGTRYRTFIQDCGTDGARYFVTKQQPAQETMDKQSLTRNVLVFDREGNKLAPLEQPVTQIFFSSLTFDLLNNSESSKKSILQKITELYIEN